MDVVSVAYVLCRIEDDASLTPISEHEDIAAAVAAGKHRVEAEDFDYGYALFADGVKVASFADGRVGYREWARRNGRLGGPSYCLSCHSETNGTGIAGLDALERL